MIRHYVCVYPYLSASGTSTSSSVGRCLGSTSNPKIFLALRSGTWAPSSGISPPVARPVHVCEFAYMHIYVRFHVLVVRSRTRAV